MVETHRTHIKTINCISLQNWCACRNASTVYILVIKIPKLRLNTLNAIMSRERRSIHIVIYVDWKLPKTTEFQPNVMLWNLALPTGL